MWARETYKSEAERDSRHIGGSGKREGEEERERERER